MKISENIKNGPKNLKNVSSENQGKNKELPAVGKSQRSLYDHIACIFPIFSFLAKTLSFLQRWEHFCQKWKYVCIGKICKRTTTWLDFIKVNEKMAIFRFDLENERFMNFFQLSDISLCNSHLTWNHSPQTAT